MAMDRRRDASSFLDIRLDAGQTLRLPVVAGSVLVAAGGRLRIAGPPRWLGERMVAMDLMLDEGQAHAIDGAGWVAVDAVDGAGGRLWRIDPLPVARWSWDRLRLPWRGRHRPEALP
jgi:hypothetical protein